MVEYDYFMFLAISVLEWTKRCFIDDSFSYDTLIFSIWNNYSLFLGWIPLFRLCLMIWWLRVEVKAASLTSFTHLFTFRWNWILTPHYDEKGKRWVVEHFQETEGVNFLWSLWTVYTFQASMTSVVWGQSCNSFHLKEHLGPSLDKNLAMKASMNFLSIWISSCELWTLE